MSYERGTTGELERDHIPESRLLVSDEVVHESRFKDVQKAFSLCVCHPALRRVTEKMRDLGQKNCERETRNHASIAGSKYSEKQIQLIQSEDPGSLRCTQHKQVRDDNTR